MSARPGSRRILEDFTHNSRSRVMYLFVCVYWGGGGKGKTFYNVKQLEMQNIRPFKALEDTSLFFRDRDSYHMSS